MPKTPKIKVPTILFWPQKQLSTLLTEANKSCLKPSFETLKDAITFCEKEANEDPEWIRCPEDSSGFFFPAWKSVTPIHSNTYEHEFMKIKEVEFNYYE